MKTQTFWRLPFEVEAVQVTLENMEEIAKWTGGIVKSRPPISVRGETETIPYVRVETSYPLSERQRRAYAGDWVLLHENGTFKIFKQNAFEKCFSPYAIEAKSPEPTDPNQSEIELEYTEAPYLVG